MSRRSNRRVAQQVSGEAMSALSTGLVALSQEVRVIEVDIDKIVPNPDQPRRIFDEKPLLALAQSILDKGLLQPILVKKDPAAEGGYILAAGERRWRAHRLIGRGTIRAICISGDVDEIAIVENAQRVDLHPVESAMAIRRLSEVRQCTDEDLAALTGLSRVEITKLIGVARLPDETLGAFLEMSPPPSKSVLFEVAMAPDIMQAELARLVIDGASVADLRQARKKGDEAAEGVVIGDLRPEARAASPALERRIKSMTKTLGALRIEGKSLNEQERDRLLDLRDAIEVLLKSS